MFPFEIQDGILLMGNDRFRIEEFRPAFEEMHPSCRVDFMVLCSNAQTERALASKMPADTTEREFNIWLDWWKGRHRERFLIRPDFA